MIFFESSFLDEELNVLANDLAILFHEEMGLEIF